MSVERITSKKGKVKKYILIVLALLVCCAFFNVEDDGEVNETLIDTSSSVLQSECVSDDLWQNEQKNEEPNPTGSKPTETQAEITSSTTAATETTIEVTEVQQSVTTVIASNSTFSVKFIDVGQADAALVECDGHYMLIDGGNKGDSNVIYSVLKKKGVTHLDIVVGTHAHEDHIGGLPGAFNFATADLTLCPVKTYDSQAFEDFADYASQNGNGITVPNVGDEYFLGSALVTILGVNSETDTNNTSIVLKIQYGETSFLFTGDAEREAEQIILNAGFDLSATVLKVGHHGSDTSTTYPFLREIMPEYAVISVGDDNSYGHPTEDTLSRLRDADVTVYRTDLHGDIVFTSDGKSVAVAVDKQSHTSESVSLYKAEIDEITTASESTENTDYDVNENDYVVNVNTGKFHYSYCSSVKKMKESNKMFFTGTRDDLIDDGYSPCGNCHP